MIIALASQKGGTGKTTTAAAIWAAFPRSLAIDLDPQGNFTFIGGVDEDVKNLYHIFTGDCTVQSAIQELAQGDFVASSPRLSELSDLSPFTLVEALKPVRDSYEHIVIDTPPFLNDLTLNALTVADVLIIPMQADILSIRGLNQLFEVVESIREETNPSLKIGGLLITRFNKRSALRRQMVELAAETATEIGTRVFNTTIREAVAIPKSQAMGRLLVDYAPHEKVTGDYKAFVAELSEVLSDGR